MFDYIKKLFGFNKPAPTLKNKYNAGAGFQHGYEYACGMLVREGKDATDALLAHVLRAKEKGHYTDFERGITAGADDFLRPTNLPNAKPVRYRGIPFRIVEVPSNSTAPTVCRTIDDADRMLSHGILALNITPTLYAHLLHNHKQEVSFYGKL